jgi:hypothetical protein
MHAQIIYFDRPRTPEELAAADFALRERVVPAVSQLGHPYRAYELRRDDGTQVTIVFADSEEALLDAEKAIMATELLPGEDPALLPGPDRIELLPVTEVYDGSAVGTAK